MNPGYSLPKPEMEPLKRGLSNSRINPGQVPRPDKPQVDLVYHTRSGTGRRNPPSVNSVYSTIDTGNCSPRFARSTLVAPPISADLLNQTGLPFSLQATPFAEQAQDESEINVLDLDGMSPVRCRRCGGYINPNVIWLDNGNKWGCNLCDAVNATPEWYKCPLDTSGLRFDRLSRPELNYGSIEFIIPDSLFPDPIKEPAIIFALDVSLEAVQDGFTIASIRAIRSLLRSMSSSHINIKSANSQHGKYLGLKGHQERGKSEVKVGILTFNRNLHFYDVDPISPDPVKLLVCDPDDPFSPLPSDRWMFSTTSQMDNLMTLLDKIPELLNKLSTPTHGLDRRLCCSSAAMRASQQALEKYSGRVYVFSSFHATVGYAGAIVQRDSLLAYGTPRELSMYSTPGSSSRSFLDRRTMDLSASLTQPSVSSSEPSDNQSKSKLHILDEENWELAKHCISSSVSVNVFLMANSLYKAEGDFVFSSDYADLCLRTGGRLHLARGTMMSEDNVRWLEMQLMDDFHGYVGSGAIAKLRTSKGFLVDQVISPGNFMKLEEELQIPGIDQNTSMMFSLGLNATLKDEEKCHLQLAILYTNQFKRRAIRVHNLTLILSNKPQVIFRNSDIEAVSAHLAKVAAMRALDHALNDEKQGPRPYLLNSLVETLLKYRKLCSPQSPKAQLVLPEALKILPIYTLGLLKHPALLENISLQGSGALRGPPSASTPRQVGAGAPVAPRPPTHVLLVAPCERAYELRRLFNEPLKEIINSIYPRVYNLFSIMDGGFFLDDAHSASLESLDPAGYLSSNSLGMSLSRAPSLNVNNNSGHANLPSITPEAVSMAANRERVLATEYLPAASQEFEGDQIYLVDDRSYLWIYIGRSVPQDLLEELFLLPAHAPYERPEELNVRSSTILGKKVEIFIEAIAADCRCRPDIKVIWADLHSNNRLMSKFTSRLVEDNCAGLASHTDFLVNVHSRIQAKM